MNIEERCLKEVKKRYKHNRESRGKEIEQEKLNKLLRHSKKVRKISLKISETLGVSDRDKKLIGIAALLHDIEKPKKKHNEKGAEFIKKKAKKYYEKNDKYFLGCTDEEIELISLMIKYHKKEGYMDRELNDRELKMTEIVRIADKIAKLYKKKNIKTKKKINETKSEVKDEINKLINEEVKEEAKNILKKRLKKLEELT
ncbi:HD domain-containing protein [Tissierella carlieri]|uniref:HD domain-containing protein n=1 Tax=Tissierella carlieri TaxID=689904 RepID=A0ABT1S525_9FIRM|nr:HD domain-containing protein [Tissierella carlieri]MCQ4921571.1 HD domain-containing protein [Tissierella carlieri]